MKEIKGNEVVFNKEDVDDYYLPIAEIDKIYPESYPAIIRGYENDCYYYVEFDTVESLKEKLKILYECGETENFK